MKKLNKGITLVALIITIIILLILAGITIGILTESDLFGKTKLSKQANLEAQAIEDVKLKILEVQSDNQGDFSLKELVKILIEDTENSYLISLDSKIAQLSNDNEDPDISEKISDSTKEIYVTNEKYGVEVKVTNLMKVSIVKENDEDEEVVAELREPDDFLGMLDKDYTVLSDYSLVYIVMHRASAPVLKRDNVQQTPVDSDNNGQTGTLAHYMSVYKLEDVKAGEQWNLAGTGYALCYE